MTVHTLRAPALPSDPGPRAWSRWLGGVEAARPPLPLLPPLHRMERTFARTVAAQPVWADHVVDWVFPADSMASTATLQRLAGWRPPMGPHLIRQVLDAPGVDERMLRSYYAEFLATLGATVGHHGQVSATDDDDQRLGQALRALDARGVRLLARVLRFLVLAGWRGFRFDGQADPFDFSYAHGLRNALHQAWGEGGPTRPYPSPWRMAMRGPHSPSTALELCGRRIRVLDGSVLRL